MILDDVVTRRIRKVLSPLPQDLLLTLLPTSSHQLSQRTFSSHRHVMSQGKSKAFISFSTKLMAIIQVSRFRLSGSRLTSYKITCQVKNQIKIQIFIIQGLQACRTTKFLSWNRNHYLHLQGFHWPNNSFNKWLKIFYLCYISFFEDTFFV